MAEVSAGKIMANDNNNGGPASSGHQLGQLVGDWFQDFFVMPLLDEVASRLKLYLDHRNKKRTARGDKIIWQDEDGNAVDYDFVMELGGTDARRGIPVAFLECFWRRGSRHSKDKARDDSGKLVPMRNAYPTARFLGIVASGDFTTPAKELIRSRDIDLLYVPKKMIIDTFGGMGMVMDYSDKADEAAKMKIAECFKASLTKDKKIEAYSKLRSLLGEVTVTGYVDRVFGALSAAPIELSFVAQNNSERVVFDTVEDATKFLQKPGFDFSDPVVSYLYRVEYSDGAEFERSVPDVESLRDLHKQIETLEDHLNTIRSH